MAVRFLVIGTICIEEKTTTVSDQGGAVFDLIQILDNLVRNMSRSQFY